MTGGAPALTARSWSGRAPSESAAVVRCPVGLAAGGESVSEHLVLLGDRSVSEVGRVAAVGGPGPRAELIQPAVAGRVHDLRVAAGFPGDDALAERAAGIRPAVARGIRGR